MDATSNSSCIGSCVCNASPLKAGADPSAWRAWSTSCKPRPEGSVPNQNPKQGVTTHRLNSPVLTRGKNGLATYVHKITPIQDIHAMHMFFETDGIHVNKWFSTSNSRHKQWELMLSTLPEFGAIFSDLNFAVDQRSKGSHKPENAWLDGWKIAFLFSGAILVSGSVFHHHCPHLFLNLFWVKNWDKSWMIVQSSDGAFFIPIIPRVYILQSYQGFKQDFEDFVLSGCKKTYIVPLKKNMMMKHGECKWQFKDQTKKPGKFTDPGVWDTYKHHCFLIMNKWWLKKADPAVFLCFFLGCG